jgi:hypothetical protein
VKIPARISFFLFLFCFASAIYAQQYWIEQPCPTTKALTELAFPDSLNGWACGDSGVIIHTSNAGLNWVVQSSGVTAAVDDIFFLTNSRGWALVNDSYFTGTIILTTTNGGTNWNFQRFPDTTIIFKSIYFLDSLRGFLGGVTYSSTKIKYTTNGGANWLSSHIDSNDCNNFPVLAFRFYGPLTGFAVGGYKDRAGLYWKTTDGGLNWRDSCIAAEPLIDIILLNGSRLASSGGDLEFGSYVYSSLDMGSSWRPTALLVNSVPGRISSRTPEEFWIPMGYGDAFVVSTDTAKTWTIIPIADSVKPFDTRFPTPYSGWTVGAKGSKLKGVILKYNSSVIGISSSGNTVPKVPFLFQNYPNPFNPVTQIRFVLQEESFAVLKVFDVSGKLAATLLSGVQKAGEYNITFDASALASGVYFYELSVNSKGGQYKSNKKMVLVK